MKVDLIPIDVIERSVTSPQSFASEPRSADAGSRDADSYVRHWNELVGLHQLDLPMAPQWSAISALSGDTAALFKAIRVSGGDGTVAYAALLESRVRQYGFSLLMRELPGCRLLCYHPSLVSSGGFTHLVDGLLTLSGSRCDLLYVPEVVRGGPADLFIEQLATQRGWLLNRVPSSRAPYLPLSGSWKDYLASRSSNFRYTLKRKRKALGEKGAVSEQWFCDPEHVPQLLQHIENVEEKSWKVAGDMAITRSRQETRYHQLLLPWLARTGNLAANVLFVDAKPAAYSLCYLWQGRMAQTKTSFCEEFAECSPGLLVTASAIERAHELGMTEFDFLGDAMLHKATWTKSTRDHDHLYLYTSGISARLVGTMKKLVQKMRRADRQLTVGRSGLKETSAK